MDVDRTAKGVLYGTLLALTILFGTIIWAIIQFVQWITSK